MTTNIRILIFIFSCLYLSSCGDDDSTTSPPLEEEVVETIIPDGDENYLNLDSDYIFDQNKLPIFEINMPLKNLRDLDSDPTAEIYEEGSITFEGETVSPVGIRYKGSLGAFAGCVSGGNLFEPSGVRTCTKLSMKIKFNWNGSDTKFFGLKKLQLHSMKQDPTQMRERLGYHLFRAMGVPAPRCIHAKLFINGEYKGVFALVEQIDGRFTRYNYEDGKGNLYKETWPTDIQDMPKSDIQYMSGLKTNEDENPSFDLIKSFASDISNSKEEDLKEVVEQWMDMETTMAYVMVDRVIRNDDGAFHWYCSGGSCENHNFYWYEETSKNKLHIIPWDLDHSFENIISNENGIVAVRDEWNNTSNNCQPFGAGLLGLIKQRSAACDKITKAWTQYENEFNTLKQDFIQGPFSETEVETLLDKWHDQIEDATLEAEQMHNDALSTGQWEASISNMRDKLKFAREN